MISHTDEVRVNSETVMVSTRADLKGKASQAEHDWLRREEGTPHWRNALITLKRNDCEYEERGAHWPQVISLLTRIAEALEKEAVVDDVLEDIVSDV